MDSFLEDFDHNILEDIAVGPPADSIMEDTIAGWGIVKGGTAEHTVADIAGFDAAVYVLLRIIYVLITG
jgi:hypothetical protein